MKDKSLDWFSERTMSEGKKLLSVGASAGFDLSSVDANSAVLQVCPARTDLFRQGAAPETVFMIATGLVKLIRVESDGREMIVDLRYPGSLLGAAETITQQPHALTALSVTECCLKCFPAKLFLQLLKTDSHLSWTIHEIHSQELRRQRERIIELGCLSARHRLVNLLLQLLPAVAANPTAQEARFQVPLKDWEIAELIAVTPSYLSRLFSELEKEKLINKRGRNLTLTDPLNLWHWAETHLPSA